MEIPDRYAPYSLYVGIMDSDGETVGTYRIVIHNSAVGLPIEETGFNLNQFNLENSDSEPVSVQHICEMSRLAILKDKRGKVPFGKIIDSACRIAQQYNNSLMLAALLPQNVRLFQRHGFGPVGPPLQDLSVTSGSETESDAAAVIVPMKIQVQPTSKLSRNPSSTRRSLVCTA